MRCMNSQGHNDDGVRIRSQLRCDPLHLVDLHAQGTGCMPTRGGRQQSANMSFEFP